MDRLRFLPSLVRGLAVAALASACAMAQNSAVDVSQLHHKAWRLQEGELPGMPNLITQTKDGYLWLAAESGLYRFNGQHFEEVLINQKPVLRARSLVANDDGSVWVASASQVLRWDGGTLKEISHDKFRVDQLIQGAPGEVLAATTRNGSTICRLRVTKVDCLKPAKLTWGVTLAKDASGGLWVSDGKRLEHRINDQVIPLPQADSAKTSDINVLSGSKSGIVWAGRHADGQLPGLIYMQGGTWHDGPKLPDVDTSTRIGAIFVDREGAVWVGTSDHGLYRIRGEQVDRYSHADSLSSDDVRDVFQDAEGSVWVATSEGVDQFHRSLVDTWSTREGLTADSVSAILADHKGRIWMANEGGLDVLENGQLRCYRAGHGLPGQVVAGLAEDHLGRIWVGIDDELYIFDGHTFQRVPGPVNGKMDIPVVLREDAKGRMWVQTRRQLIRVTSTGFDVIGGEATMSVTAMTPDEKGGMWLGIRGHKEPVYAAPDATSIDTWVSKTNNYLVDGIFSVNGTLLTETQQGVFATRGGTTYGLTQKNGLPFKTLYGSQLSLSGDLYLATESAYLRVTKTDLQRWLQNPNVIVHPQIISASDGALPSNPVFAPAVSMAPNGEIWFATDRFPQRITPTLFDGQRSAPPLKIEGLTADGKKLDLATQATLPAGTQSADIEYTALSYLNPQNVHYKYLLQGFDRDWQNADTRRTAIYTHLPPGTYTFLVAAEDTSGFWTTPNVELTFDVAPHFYQTLWFRALLAVSAVCLLWLAYLLRTRSLVRQANARLFERMSERERIARDLHDSFFQGIQGLLLRFQTATSTMPADEPIRPVFEEILRQSDGVMLEGRELVLDLREHASEKQDLADAFAVVCKELKQMFPINYQILVQGHAIPLEPIVHQELFYLGREALMNSFQHSGGRNIEVELIYSNRSLSLRVRDDGKGLDTSVKEAGHRVGHFGLPGMRERAQKIRATFEVLSQVDAGTEIDVQVPADMAFGSKSKYWSWLLKLRDTQA